MIMILLLILFFSLLLFFFLEFIWGTTHRVCTPGQGYTIRPATQSQAPNSRPPEWALSKRTSCLQDPRSVLDGRSKGLACDRRTPVPSVSTVHTTRSLRYQLDGHRRRPEGPPSARGRRARRELSSLFLRAYRPQRRSAWLAGCGCAERS